MTRSGPDCYKCKHRGEVPGSAHSRCKHPSTGVAHDNPMLGLFAIFASVGRVPAINADTGLNIKGDPHGIRNGWFNWPFNFDPTWLENCEGFEAKDGTTPSRSPE